jgi:hypothetical protein
LRLLIVVVCSILFADKSREEYTLLLAKNNTEVDEIAKLRRELKQETFNYDTLNNVLGLRDEQILTLKTELEEKDKQIRELQHYKESWNAEMQKLNQQLAEEKHALGKLQSSSSTEIEKLKLEITTATNILRGQLRARCSHGL